jgi:hypothetical protein
MIKTFWRSQFWRMKTPCFLRGLGGIQCYQTTHVSTYPKKATIPLNVLSYNMFNLKAPLFKGGWGGSNAIKQPTFPLILKKQQPHRKTLFSQGKY